MQRVRNMAIVAVTVLHCGHANAMDPQYVFCTWHDAWAKTDYFSEVFEGDPLKSATYEHSFGEYLGGHYGIPRSIQPICFADKTSGDAKTHLYTLQSESRNRYHLTLMQTDWKY